MSDFYDRQGKPLPSTKAWVDLNCDKEYKTVAYDQRGDYSVSTVWLGMDHQYGYGPPLIFETMIFGGDRDSELWERYSTEDEAEAGHADALADVVKPGPTRAA